MIVFTIYLWTASNFLRKTEEKLAKAHQKEMDLQVADHLRETQNLVYEFNRAQEHLKEKCSALQLMYVKHALYFSLEKNVQN